MLDNVAEAAVEYFKTDRTERFGQWYINNYMPKDTVWPELFYEWYNVKAMEMIRERQYKESAQ